MSMSDIRIHRDLAVINGYVQVPPNQESDKSRVTLADAEAEYGDSANTIQLTGSGASTGSHFGAQRIFRLPGVIPGESLGADDPVQRLARFQ